MVSRVRARGLDTFYLKGLNMTCRNNVVDLSREFWTRKVERYMMLYENEYITRKEFKRYMSNMGFEEASLEKLLLEDEEYDY